MSIEWLNGRLLDEADPALAPAVNGMNATRCSCITTARVTAGNARHLEYHVRRLSRDAHAIGLGSIDPQLMVNAFSQLGRAVFGNESGIVCIEARPNTDGSTANLRATARPLGDESARWTARTAPMIHSGPQRFPGAKLASCPLYDDARAFLASSGVNEALLFDAHGRLVEGANTNVLVGRSDGTLSTPDSSLGAVAGIALEIIREQVPELESVEIFADDLRSAHEVIAVNAVRGARPLVQLDDQKVGSGDAGPWAKRLDAILAAPC